MNENEREDLWQRLEVCPTSLQGQTSQYSDIALTGLFSAHVSLISSERQAIWQRFTAMLIANSLIFSFLTQTRRTGDGRSLEAIDVTVAVVFGLLLCVAWWGMTVSG